MSNTKNIVHRELEKKFKEAQKLQNHSQKEALAEIGCTRQHFREVLRGRRPLSENLANSLASYLNLPLPTVLSMVQLEKRKTTELAEQASVDEYSESAFEGRLMRMRYQNGLPSSSNDALATDLESKPPSSDVPTSLPTENHDIPKTEILQLPKQSDVPEEPIRDSEKNTLLTLLTKNRLVTSLLATAVVGAVVYQLINPTSYLRNFISHGNFSKQLVIESTCNIRFAENKPSPISCDNIGPVELSGPTKDWNGISTLVHIPDGWFVVGHYQHWDGTNDWALVEEDQGFFRLKNGMNNLRIERYELYHDENLEKYYRAMRADESTNDRLQGLRILKAEKSTDKLSVWEHEDTTKGRRLDFSLSPPN